MPSAQNISLRSARNKHADDVLLLLYCVNVIVALLKQINVLMFNAGLFHFVWSRLVADTR